MVCVLLNVNIYYQTYLKNAAIYLFYQQHENLEEMAIPSKTGITIFDSKEKWKNNCSRTE